MLPYKTKKTQRNKTKAKGMVRLIHDQVHRIIDKDTLAGIAGVSMSVGIPFMEFLTKAFQFVGAFAGLFLLYFAIKHKVMEIKKLEREEKNGNTGK